MLTKVLKALISWFYTFALFLGIGYLINGLFGFGNNSFIYNVIFASTLAFAFQFCLGMELVSGSEVIKKWTSKKVAI